MMKTMIMMREREKKRRKDLLAELRRVLACQYLWTSELERHRSGKHNAPLYSFFHYISSYQCWFKGRLSGPLRMRHVGFEPFLKLCAGHVKALGIQVILCFCFCCCCFNNCIVRLGFPPHEKFGLPSPRKVSCDRVALPNLRCMLGLFTRPAVSHCRCLLWPPLSLCRHSRSA